ncbi:MAG TPA: hypothetical protein VN954_06570 [Ktedonobacteraceae bacterium]|nr:hypothetical protein [Ktedonobacteraceae bacterium]
MKPATEHEMLLGCRLLPKPNTASTTPLVTTEISSAESADNPQK